MNASLDFLDIPVGERSIPHQLIWANLILSQVREYLDEDAVVAGGFARDLLLLSTPKDLDIWFYSELPLEWIEDAIRAAFPHAERKPTLIAEYGSPSAVWTKAIFKLTIDGFDIDLILFSGPVGANGQNVLNMFDFGICEAYYDGSVLNGTERFWSDVHNQTITFNENAREREDLTRILSDHLPRLQEKFPTYKPMNIPLGVELRRVATGLRAVVGGVPLDYL